VVAGTRRVMWRSRAAGIGAVGRSRALEAVGESERCPNSGDKLSVGTRDDDGVGREPGVVTAVVVADEAPPFAGVARATRASNARGAHNEGIHARSPLSGPQHFDPLGKLKIDA